MASSSKRVRVSFISAEIALEEIFDDEDSAGGMGIGEGSDLDRQLENESGRSRWEVNIGHRETLRKQFSLNSHAWLRVLWNNTIKIRCTVT